MTVATPPKLSRVKQYGDYQTPRQLAEEIARAISSVGFKPRSVFEPTCGRGAFIHAALRQFPSVERILGVEIDRAILSDLTHRLDLWPLGLTINTHYHNYEYEPPPQANDERLRTHTGG